MVNSKLKKLLLIALLTANSGLVSASIEDMSRLGAEATAEEAKLSYRDIPELKQAFISAAPAARKGGIPVGKLGVDGGNKDMLVELAQEIASGNHGHFDSLLVAHKGKLLFESYYSRGRINLPHYQASATKVYTSLALGRAIQLGYLSMADLDKPLISFLKELDSTKLVDGAQKITLNHALTMRSGIRISDEQRETFEKNPSQLKGQREIQTYLEQSAPITAQSQSFKYQGDPRLVMQVVEAVVPGTAKDFIKNELLDKLGITNYRWRSHASGLPEAGWRVSMTSRDMVKWGTLAINKGKWNGEQLIPAAYIARATSKIVDPGEEYADDVVGAGVSGTAYGYFWWQADLTAGNKSYLSKAARGGGGQFIIVIEELELVVVVTANRRNFFTSSFTATRILPAFVQDSSLAESGSSDSQDKSPILEDPYFGLKPPGMEPQPFAPGIVSQKGWELGGVHAPDMNEFYMTSSLDVPFRPLVVSFRKEDRVWKKYKFYSTGSNVMYSKDKYIERTDTGWSEIKSLGAPFEDFRIMRLTASKKGTLVFDERTKEGNGVLRYSRLVNGKREAPRPFGKEINTGKWTAHPFIAPDESYIIWGSEREGGYGSSDMYISFRQPDGSWGKAINFGDKINTDGEDGGGYVTPDGKYLFYCPRCSRPFDRKWVDAQIIETLRPNKTPATTTIGSP